MTQFRTQHWRQLFFVYIPTMHLTYSFIYMFFERQRDRDFPSVSSLPNAPNGTGHGWVRPQLAVRNPIQVCHVDSRKPTPWANTYHLPRTHISKKLRLEMELSLNLKLRQSDVICGSLVCYTKCPSPDLYVTSCLTMGYLNFPSLSVFLCEMGTFLLHVNTECNTLSIHLEKSSPQ